MRSIGVGSNGAQRLNGQGGGLSGDVAHGLEDAGSAAGVAGLALGPGGVCDRPGGASNQGWSRGITLGALGTFEHDEDAQARSS